MADEDLYERLKRVRTSESLSMPPSRFLRSTFVGLDGVEKPLKFRSYQIQAIYHLLVVKRFVLGDATGTGKTLSVLGSICCGWEKHHNNVIVACPKSAIQQWAGEIERFTTGVEVFVVTGDKSNRLRVYDLYTQYCAKGGYCVLVVGHHSILQDSKEIEWIKPYTIVWDECHVFKTPSTKMWVTARTISNSADRVIGLSATLLKNHLLEGFGIFSVVVPSLWKNKTTFMARHCTTRTQRIGNRKIPIVTGYKNLDLFRLTIDPYYLGRAKHDISNDLPVLTTTTVPVQLNRMECTKYIQTLEGTIRLASGDERSTEAAIVQLNTCQQVVDSISLLGYTEDQHLFDPEEQDLTKRIGLGSKEQTLLELLIERYCDENVIIYCHFSSLIPKLVRTLKSKGIEALMITGDVVDTPSNPARTTARERFNDPNDPIRVLFISDAGSEALNLQTASVMIFYNAPWSWGNYVQLLGRAIRIGSPHQHVTAVHLVATLMSKPIETIDHYTLALLNSKKQLIESVMGGSEGLEFRDNDFIQQLAAMLKRKR